MVVLNEKAKKTTTRSKYRRKRKRKQDPKAEGLLKNNYNAVAQIEDLEIDRDEIHRLSKHDRYETDDSINSFVAFALDFDEKTRALRLLDRCLLGLEINGVDTNPEQIVAKIEQMVTGRTIPSLEEAIGTLLKGDIAPPSEADIDFKYKRKRKKKQFKAPTPVAIDTKDSDEEEADHTGGEHAEPTEEDLEALDKEPVPLDKPTAEPVSVEEE